MSQETLVLPGVWDVDESGLAVRYYNDEQAFIEATLSPYSVRFQGKVRFKAGGVMWVVAKAGDVYLSRQDATPEAIEQAISVVEKAMTEMISQCMEDASVV